MKKVTIPGFICLALMLVPLPFVACAEEAPAPVTPAAPAVAPAGDTGDGMFTVLDPRGIEPEREFKAISPRLDTLSGKKVGVVNLHGGNEIVMTTIAPSIKALVPDCNIVYYSAEGTRSIRSQTDADWEFIESCDAVIFGHDY